MLHRRYGYRSNIIRREDNFLDKIVWLLTIFVLTTYLIFSGYSWGRYAFLAVSILIGILTTIADNCWVPLRFGPFHWFMLLFAAFALLSSAWAMNAGDAKSKATTILQILLCASMLYLHYEKKDSIDDLLLVVMWAGYVVTLYTIAFFGLDYLKEAAEDSRMESEYANSNLIGIAVALACTIQVHFFANKKHRWSSIFLIPAVLIIAASQSRKALLLLVIGVFGVYLAKIAEDRDLLKKTLRLLTAVLVLVVAFSLLYSLPIFDGVRDRMDSMFASVTGEGKVDNSTNLRNSMIQLGLEWFKERPILGIGIGNTHIIAATYLLEDTYLHNNYVELLCSGGIIGFAIYYGMYVYLFVKLIQYRKVDQARVGLGLVWLVLMLIMDYGMVSYYSKEQWIYLMIHFLNVTCLGKEHRRKRNEFRTII